jgi:anti-anti-sigma regulatory factor
MAKKQTKVSDRIRLPAIFNQEDGAGVCDAISVAYQNNQSVILDSSELDRIGAFGVQFLLCSAKSFREKTVSFSIQSPSDALIEAFDLLGCSEHAKTLGMFV